MSDPWADDPCLPALGAQGDARDERPEAVADWSRWSSYVLRTGELPGLSGQIKQAPEDFLVEEVPAYEPEGCGEHVYLWVQKRDVSAGWLERQLAQVLGVSRGDIGMAGLKDRGAVTRQWVSLPARQVLARVGQDLTALLGPLRPGDDSILILQASQHRHKLRRGHLRGNRFELNIHELPPRLGDDEALKRAQRKLDWLATHGMPNYFGPQRFGHGGHTLRLGLGLLARDAAVTRQLEQDRMLKRLALNAVQSAHFNLILAQRLRRSQAQGAHDLTPEPGDVLKRRDSGGLFVVPHEPQALDEARRRHQDAQVVLTGPLWGPKMLRPQAQPAHQELAALAQLGVAPEAFDAYDRLCPGERRPLLIWPEPLSLELRREPAAGRALRVKFFLPSGSYATILCREILSEMNPEGEPPASWSLDAIER